MGKTYNTEDLSYVMSSLMDECWTGVCVLLVYWCVGKICLPLIILYNKLTPQALPKGGLHVLHSHGYLQ